MIFNLASITFLASTLAVQVVQAGNSHDGAPLYARHNPHHAHGSFNHSGVVEKRQSPFRLDVSYEGQTFFDNWDFFDFPDPTNGRVQYVNRDVAFGEGLAFVRDDGVAIMKVDDTTVLQEGQNRKSVRIVTQRAFNGGLFLLDVKKMPFGCSVWPAAWTTAKNWPTGGEIDIIEGIHTSVNNRMTLHTDPGCNVDIARANGAARSALENAFTGEIETTNCDASVNFNIGCGIGDQDERSFGQGLNDAGGAVFATLWNDEGIKIWFFSRCEVPEDILSSNPDPSTWPAPKAFFSSSTCPTTQFFKDNHFVINTTLCGDLGEATFGEFGCPGTCAQHVANPENFRNAVWKINSLRVYQPN